MAARWHGQRWFLRGFVKFSSLFSLFALFSARFSRIDLPTFLAAPLFGDFPDIGITPFFACVTRYHTHFNFLCQSGKGAHPHVRSRSSMRSPIVTLSVTQFPVFDQKKILVFSSQSPCTPSFSAKKMHTSQGRGFFLRQPD